MRLHGDTLDEPMAGDGSFDFWIGNWTTRWKDARGRGHVGSNVVLKLDQSVRELFEGPSKPRRYVGVSVSNWDVASSEWQQEYWDNTGYHASFHGGWRGDRFILDQVSSEPPLEVRRRLVWRAVSVETLLWDYEASVDGGRTWTSDWHIAYRRDQPK